MTQQRLYQLALLWRAERVEDEHDREVADARALSLKVAVESGRPVGQVLPDDAHLEVRAVGSSERRWQPVPVQPGFVGAAHHLDQQLLPLAGRCAAPLQVRASELTTVIEELRVIFLERREFALDERVDLRQQGREITLLRHRRDRTASLSTFRR